MTPPGGPHVFKFRPQILSTRQFKGRFFECLQRHPKTLRVASPYVGEIPGFGSIVRFARYVLKDEGICFQLITCPPTLGKSGETRYISDSFAGIIVTLGVDLVIRHNPYLHSKIYHFEFLQGDTVSFVGSANMTMGGFERNDETVAMFHDPEVNKKVGEELNRLASYGSDKYAKWKFKRLRITGGDHV